MLEAQQNEHQVLKIDIRGNITKFAMVIEMAGIFLLFQILTDGVFLSSLNLSNLLLQGCTFSILGIGMVWVMVSGGIDLSAGAVLGFWQILQQCCRRSIIWGQRQPFFLH